MSSDYYVGKSLSYDGKRCTVLYIGEVEGTGADKQWLGVEWEDPMRGKHNGTYKGNEYFKCRSPSATAASFIRTTRKADPEQSFVEAVKEKYRGEQDDSKPEANEITISGKVAEEIGFDKIRAVQARLHELKIVLVDGRRISKARKKPGEIQKVCPMIEELDLSRNPICNFSEIVNICYELSHLKVLKINGIQSLDMAKFDHDMEYTELCHEVFSNITDLSMDEMYLDWYTLTDIVARFKNVNVLSASMNGFSKLTRNFIRDEHLVSLTFEYNNFTSLADLQPVKHLSSLAKLNLKGNRISAIGTLENNEPVVLGSRITYVDLSFNSVASWEFVDSLAAVFPGLQALRLSHNPIYDSNVKDTGTFTTMDDAYMLTLARIPGLESLNFGKITPVDRSQSEMLYLSKIAKELSAVPEAEEYTVLARHKRYDDLCKLHGAPTIAREEVGVLNPKHLEARLIKFTFYLPPNTQDGQAEQITMQREIPMAFDVYRVKGIVGKMFVIRPLSLRLIWETGEVDPVPGYIDYGDSEAEEDEAKLKTIDGKAAIMGEKKGWMKRETEIEDGTRQVGMWVDGSEATVRLELR